MKIKNLETVLSLEQNERREWIVKFSDGYTESFGNSKLLALEYIYYNCICVLKGEINNK